MAGIKPKTFHRGVTMNLFLPTSSFVDQNKKLESSVEEVVMLLKVVIIFPQRKEDVTII